MRTKNLVFFSLVAAASALALSLQAAPTAKSSSGSVQEIVLDGGPRSGWQDWGWATRNVVAGKPAALHFSKYAGWILAHPKLEGNFTALQFNLHAPSKLGDFLEASLVGPGDEAFPSIPVTAANSKAVGDGWVQVRIAMSELNPGKIPFDRIKLRAGKNVGDDEVLLDKIILLGGPPEAPVDPAVAMASAKSHPSRLAIDCRAPARPISPMIYGIAQNPQRIGADSYMWDMGITSRRWGGNHSSRYNWKIGNAWNTAMDWYFMNVNYSGEADYSWKSFLDENRQHHVTTAMTLPMIGWVAKDTKSASFPVSVYGEQQYTNNEMGNGKRQGGGVISADPTRTSVKETPASIGEWVKAIREHDSKTHGRNVHQYILDNEPALWNSTHRDVHPQPLTYDELLEKTIEYGTAVRKADPDAVIAGPAEWGWPAYFFSAKDAEAGFTVKPDRRAHGDVPLLAWYLSKLRAHEAKTGTKILDVVDLHFYPQVDGCYGQGEKIDPAGAAARIRSTRSLWDPTYKDESWINEKIELLPRLQSLIDDNYPGLKMSIGEYNFGGERHISGALAQAEALGRFGQFGVHSAYYWTYPPANSCTYNAFRAFRNYDGKGGHFLERSIPAKGDARTSIFASQNATGDTMVAIALNLDPHEVAEASVQLQGCGTYKLSRAFVYTGGAEGIRALPGTAQVKNNVLTQKLLPYSITIFELKR